MQVEAALFFETVEQIYARVFQAARPRTPVPEVIVRYKKYANANSRIRLQNGHLLVEISDLARKRARTDSGSARQRLTGEALWKSSG